MNITHLLGHNSKWSIDSYIDNGIGNYFLLTAFSQGVDFDSKKAFQKILDISMIDLQFYGKKNIKGKLNEFPFHPSNCNDEEVTNIYFDNCVKQSIEFQKRKGFKNIIIPHFYENEEEGDIIRTIRNFSNYISKIRTNGERYFMTLPFAHHVIINKDKVERILLASTDMRISFDGYFVVCENKPEIRRKLTTDLKILTNLAHILKTLKYQEFETIYAYANWDAIILLALTDIDYITIGTYENLRNFDIKRYTEDASGGGSKGYYFSEKLLNMIKADSIKLLRDTDNLRIIKNDRNIFSEIILKDGYPWNIHKPDVNKNYLLSISRLLNDISNITDLKQRKRYVLSLINQAIEKYDYLEKNNIFLDKESENYHLNIWKTFLLKV